MPLEPTARPALVELDGVTFAMKNGDVLIRVFVTADALRSFSKGSYCVDR